MFMWIVTLLYVGQVAVSLYNKEWSAVAIFTGYTIAGFGLIAQLR